MQSFARQEIVWAAKEMFEASDRLKQAAETATAEIERGLCLLRAEQLPDRRSQGLEPLSDPGGSVL